MQYFLFIFKSSIEDFKRNKARTVLTSLGILIGVSSVVLLLAFGLGLKQYIKDQFESLGTNLVIATPGKLLSSQGGFSRGGGIGGINFEEKDVQLLRKMKNITYIVPAFMKTITISGNGNSQIGTLYATTADIFPMRNLDLEIGIYFDKSDVEKRSKKVVLGPKIAEKIFFSKEDALGKTIKIENQGFTVVGILKSKGGGGFGGPDFDSFVYMPYKTAFTFNPEKKFYAISVKAENDKVIPFVKEEMKNLLLQFYKEDDFSVIEQTEILNAVSSIFAIINAILVAIAAISLVVGGIGIMNIMYVSVIERVREIGIRRSFGATGKDVLLQFLCEAILLSFLGGLIGLVASIIIVAVIRRFFPAYIDSATVVIALGVSSVIGIIFGVFPAKRAADLSPIEAIRYE